MLKKILLFLIIIFPVTLFADSDKELARLYLNEAFYYYNLEAFGNAEDSLGISMKFSEELSEAWYLNGMIHEEKGNRIKALDFYSTSIDLGDVYTKYFYDLYFRYLNLLNITAHHEDVLGFFQKNSKIFERDNEILLKVSDSAYKYGLIDYSIELASDVYRRNPDNLKSLLYLIRSTGDDVYLKKIEMSLYNLSWDKLDEIIFQQLILTDSSIDKKKLMVLYREIFGETPFYYFQLDTDDDSIQNSRNLLIRSKGGGTLDDGVYFGDYNFDGVYDEIVSVDGSDLTYLKDADQDNITDLSINFSNGLPSHIFLNKNDTRYEFIYSDYPFIEELILYNNVVKREYKIFPGTVFTPLHNLDSFNWKYNSDRNLIKDDFVPDPVDLLLLSYQFNEYLSGSDTVFREYTISNGEIIRIREDSQNKGIFDHFIDISGWQPESGRRDLDYDGIIDLFEYYDNGKITGIAIDWNNNGKSEYLEDWSILNIKTWDFDEDSYSDAEYLSSYDDREYFSTPIEKGIVNQYDIYAWDFTNKNFWFNNN